MFLKFIGRMFASIFLYKKYILNPFFKKIVPHRVCKYYYTRSNKLSCPGAINYKGYGLLLGAGLYVGNIKLFFAISK